MRYNPAEIEVGDILWYLHYQNSGEKEYCFAINRPTKTGVLVRKFDNPKDDFVLFWDTYGTYWGVCTK